MRKKFTLIKYAIFIIVIQFFTTHLIAQTLPVGSYVIPMDNTLQANTAGYFNLKTYGLVVYLLNNNVKVKWSIKSGKLKDGIDFTATSEQLLPSLVSGGVSRDFKAGPFLIYAADTTGLAALITGFYTANSLTGNNRPKVYRLTAAAPNVEIRYDMSGFKPKAQILTDGKNSAIHVAYMTKAGITTLNYATGPAINLYTNCYTFASEAHTTTADSTAITAIKTFVQKGGNFLAQCAAIETYENSSAGHFHTTNGITVANNNVTTASTIYPNADLSFSQYEGVFDIAVTGSVKNWTLASGSSFINNEQNHATGGTMLTQTPIGASVAKLTASAISGGFVFYIGNHNFPTDTVLVSINGIRMYMNAFLTPVAINPNCSVGSPLPVKYLSFDAVVNDKAVLLKWVTAQEINNSHFEVERSFDRNNFSSIGLVFDGYAVNGTDKSYQFKDNSTELQYRSIVYYRLKQIDIDGKATISNVLAVRLQAKADAVLQVSPNPFMENLTARFNAVESGIAIIRISNAAGQIILSKQVTISKGYNNIQIEGLNGLATGMYVARLSINGAFIDNQRIIKN